MLDWAFFDVVGVIVIVAFFALPFYAVWFWYWWWRTGRGIGPTWRAILGGTASALATAAVAWCYIFPAILHHHYLRVGSEDTRWWQLTIVSLRLGALMSLSGLVAGALAKGRTRVFSTLASGLMLMTYFVLFAIR